MIRRYIVWRNNHAYDEKLRRIVDRANVAGRGTREAPPRTAEIAGAVDEPVLAGSSSQSESGCGSGHGVTCGAG
jgi:hypothetical protein